MTQKQQQELIEFRQKIDGIDDKIFSLLQERFSVVEEVGKWKEEHFPNRSIIRSKREYEMTEAIKNKCANLGFSQKKQEIFIFLFRTLISASVNLEQKILIGYDNKNYLADIINYFAPFSKTKLNTDLSSLLEALINDEINILVFDMNAADEEFYQKLISLPDQNRPKIFTQLNLNNNSSLVAMAKLEPEEMENETKIFFNKKSSELEFNITDKREDFDEYYFIGAYKD